MLNFTRISVIRKKKNMSQRKLAEKCKVTHGYIGLLESGREMNPTIAVLIRISKALDLEIHEFIKLLSERGKMN